MLKEELTEEEWIQGRVFCVMEEIERIFVERNKKSLVSSYELKLTSGHYCSL